MKTNMNFGRSIFPLPRIGARLLREVFFNNAVDDVPEVFAESAFQGCEYEGLSSWL